jgi:hypothetical protein
MNKLPILKRAVIAAALMFSLLAPVLAYLGAHPAARASVETTSIACWKCGARKP